MHQYIILYLWCSSSLSFHSAVLKFGAKQELHACKASRVLIVLYILLISNASWYQASRAPTSSEIQKKKRGDAHLSSAFSTSFCQLSGNIPYQKWKETQLYMAAILLLGHIALLVEAVCSLHYRIISLEFWHTVSSCLCFADTDAFYSAFTRKTLSKKTLLSTWQNQSSFNFKMLGPLAGITCMNGMTHTILLLFITYISLLSFSWQRPDN